MVLSEFLANRAGAGLRRILEEAGLVHQVPASDDPRKKSVLVASKDAISIEPFPEWPTEDSHRLVSGKIDGIHLLGAYFPTVTPLTTGMFEPLAKASERFVRSPTLLLGDLHAGSNRLDTQGAEIMAGGAFELLLEALGWRDLWREKNGEREEFTWYFRGEKGNGYRYDHALSPGHRLEVQRCWYDHSVRETGLTSHSMLVVEVEKTVG